MGAVMVMETSKQREMAEAAKALREHLGLTQIDFARELKIGLSSLQRMEDPARGPSWDQVKQIADVAVTCSRRDLARIFINAFREEWGPTLTGGIKEEKGDARENRYVELFREVYRDEPQLAKSLIGWLEFYDEHRKKRR